MDSTFVSEMMGTGLLILLGDGVVAAVLLNKSKAQNSGWIVITFGWAIAVMIGVFAATKSGAHLNPAVTIGQAAAGDLDWSKVPEYLGGQFAGAGIGAILVWLAYYAHWGETEDPGLKLAVFSTGPAIRNTLANLITEIIGTFVLVFGVYAIFKVGGDPTGSLSAGLGPVLVAFLVLGIGLSLGGPTGYAINPARDLGPRIAHAILPIPGKGPSDWGYAWVPVVGPIIGGVLGALGFDLFYPG
ncbi:MAG: glycerol uptake facilitator protein [Solirubrobacterales bacterium]|nr:glycerol uptake facilitator protein [Solirubrobacterales bacterium]